jgi:hypothetical protein
MTGLVIHALKRRLGQDARPEPSRPFRARITDIRTII